MSGRCSPSSHKARATRQSPKSLVLTKGAVEKYINAIFLKLGLSEAAEVSKRVKAVLMLLAEENEQRGEEPFWTK